MTDLLTGLPIIRIPRENDTAVPLSAVFDGAPTETYDVAITPQGQRPTTWVPNPGPKTPTTPDRYLVQIRQQGAVADIGILVVT